MKKIMLFSVAALFCSATIAQDLDTKEVPVKESGKKVKDQKTLTIDGRSFKVTFTERQMETAGTQTAATAGTDNALPTTKPDYSMFDKNSKVIFTFTDGKLLSPIFAESGCPYRVNTSGNELVAFSSYCRLNTGNETVEKPTAQDTKLEMDAAAANTARVNDNKELTPAPAAPVDETKDHLPQGTVRGDNAEMNNTPASNTPPAPTKTEEIQRQTEQPVKAQSGMMATISGVVNGNSIQGTLSWTDSDGRKMSYSYSGSAASKKDMNDSHVVGMK